jgi:nitrite reductase/ring-hydroxylating ferredoxin subunit
MLKYLFTATYRDGSELVQTPEDRSTKEPETRSAYFDIDHERLATFSLQGDGHTYLVDLRDGHFEVDGVPFWMHDEELAGFRLVFFRRHKHSFNQRTGEELSHDVVYRVGWQCTVGGKNYQQVLQVV